MEITEVRIKLTEDSDDRLQAFCSITFDDCFVVRDLKIIEGSNGPFVAMPSRKLTSHCSRCGCKNHLRAGYCNQCGSKLNPDRAPRDAEGRAKLYADIAHPINSTCRESIQDKVIAAYRQEVELSKQPGYVSRYDDDYEDDFTADDLAEQSPTARRSPTGGEAIHRTDAQSAHAGPPSPHTPTAEPDAMIDTTPPGPGRRKTGFGAGILDD